MCHFEHFRATRKNTNSSQVHLVDPQINMYNEQLVKLMQSIHSELKLIIEDELFDKVNASLP